MFKLEMIQSLGLKFRLRRFEDTQFTREYSLNCKRAVFVNDTGYNYYVNPESITSTINLAALVDQTGTDEVLRVYHKYDLDHRALQFKQDSRKFLIRKLIPYLLGNEHFNIKNTDSEFASFVRDTVDRFNNNKIMFIVDSFRYLGFKAALKAYLLSLRCRINE